MNREPGDDRRNGWDLRYREKTGWPAVRRRCGDQGDRRVTVFDRRRYIDEKLRHSERRQTAGGQKTGGSGDDEV